MKDHRYPFYLIMFSIFLACGFLVGRKVSSVAQQSLDTQKVDGREITIRNSNRLAYPLPNLDAMMNEMGNNSKDQQLNSANGPAPVQQNILVIGIDKLQSPRPQLESIWLVLYFTDTPHLTLMPIYPAFPANETASNTENIAIEHSYEMSTDHKPSEKLFNTLKDKKFWWNGYLVLDKTAMIKLIDFITHSQGGLSGYPSAAKAIASLPLARENPQDALYEQTRLIQELCNTAAQQPNSSEVSLLDQIISDHVVSDLDLQKIISEWQIRLTQNDHLTCEFPFLNQQ